jgi:hypothetical protein
MHLRLYLADVKFLDRRPQLQPQTPCLSHTLAVKARHLARTVPRWTVRIFSQARVQRWWRMIRLYAKTKILLCPRWRGNFLAPSFPLLLTCSFRSLSVTTPSSELTTATKAESSSNQVAFTEVTQNIKASPDSTATHASPVSSSDNTGSVGRPASADFCPSRRRRTPLRIAASWRHSSAN